MNITEITYKLLTEGMYGGDISLHINEINKRIRPLFYEAIMLYDRSCCILRNNSNRFIFSEFSPNDNLEIKVVFESIVNKQPVDSYILESLVHNKWIEKDNDSFKLSARTLIQFDEYVLELGGRYKRCGICKQLVDGKDIHDYCNDLINKG